MEGFLTFILIAALVVISLLIYFLPAYIAGNRNHANATAIFFLNLFFGATGVGWFILLIWAMTGERKTSTY
ncbi:MAG: superinfection immunity protein [Candidatus Omnitrophica bacterium]|nr:superinfection immunity protein [Candidatus Omnitrophota bacterium]